MGMGWVGVRRGRVAGRGVEGGGRADGAVRVGWGGGRGVTLGLHLQLRPDVTARTGGRISGRLIRRDRGALEAHCRHKLQPAPHLVGVRVRVGVRVKGER